jgi:putative multicomponent Na+:H+ antiporter subunit B
MNPTSDFYIYVIVALLPLVSAMIVFQANPYHALVIRGMLGAIAALTYSILGAADVALTEALVGTLLAITLYAIAVRSSMVMRLGVVEGDSNPADPQFETLIQDLRAVFSKRYMQLELVPYPNSQALKRALIDREIHATCLRPTVLSPQASTPYHTVVRLPRLYEILKTELASPETTLAYVDAPEVHPPDDYQMEVEYNVGEEQP